MYLSRSHCMIRRGMVGAFVAAVLLGTAITIAAAAEAGGSEEPIVVSDTFDGRPFSYRVRSVVEMSGFSVHSLTYPSPVTTDVPQNNTIPAELYLPDGYESWQSPRPAVICMHILDGDFQLVRMTCSMLASRGIPAMMFKLPYYGERSPKEGTRGLAKQPARFAAALSQAGEDIRRTVDLLASRPEVDWQHIGITGISLGAIVAATAAAEEPRLRRAMLVLGAGDLPTIIHHADELRGLSETICGLPKQQREEVDAALRAVDPLTHAAKLRERAVAGRVMMVNAAADELVPRECTERLAAALGIADDVVWLEGLGHYTAMAVMPETLQRTVQFFGQDLPSDAQLSVEKAPPTSVQIALELIQRVATLLGDTPAEGRCHVIDASVSITDSEGKEAFAAEAFVARDHEGRFKLDAANAQLGRIAFGGGSALWFLAQDTLLQGENGETPEGPSHGILRDDDVKKIRTVAGALKATTLAPGIFEQLFAVADETTEDGQAIIHVARRDGSPERLRLVLDGDRKTVRQIQIEWRSGRARIDLKAFQVNAPSHSGLFRPADAVNRQAVSNADLLRIFQAVADFGMQRLTQ